MLICFTSQPGGTGIEVHLNPSGAVVLTPVRNITYGTEDRNMLLNVKYIYTVHLLVPTTSSCLECFCRQLNGYSDLLEAWWSRIQTSMAVEFCMPTQTPAERGPISFPGPKQADMMLTTHSHLVPRLNKGYKCTSTPFWAFTAYYRANFTFIFTFFKCLHSLSTSIYYIKPNKEFFTAMLTLSHSTAVEHCRQNAYLIQITHICDALIQKPYKHKIVINNLQPRALEQNRTKRNYIWERKNKIKK